ncbi:Chaperone protein DnaK [Desulfamplus magnetovallimortis]|uniref:Chaperone protein DnaK n=1 Tax=Desulfamplus magnetovallimortis TaxID=1246637 RepID=A0A1W1HL67_9BACT|nr:Hsp70 family protein [Desulfamplus magnetovallimortis]SLM33203.1 Chaperone protein DnaK [Desulfamplus magnetovallimortis]
MEPVIGIDLGTTNSEVAFIMDGKSRIIKENDNGIVPSCVSVDGNSKRIIVGMKAKNQAVLYPNDTVLSVKRSMGIDKRYELNGTSYSPQEISAFILKELKERAERVTGMEISRAVITTPAYFTDAQRQATREAGEIAGLNVVRILNEPTAAALAYESGETKSRRILVYDLGGGTFDVSIVRLEDGVVEVLASTGDNHLGGDDFDHEIEIMLMNHLNSESGVNITDNSVARARLRHAAEQAKIELSSAPFTTIQEDFLTKNATGEDVHLSYELSRVEFENAISEYLQKTMDSVNKALKDASMLPSALDQIILVGGSTRIPMISAMLEEKFKQIPHQAIDPDLCVAMGAAIQAGREMGIESSTLLLDITPYTFGTSALGEIDGMPCKTTFVPIIKRNSKLPAVKSEAFATLCENQKLVEILVYQGEKPNALDNVKIGRFEFKLSPNLPAHSIIILKYELDINGILKVRGIEKESGREINGVIENAFSQISEDKISASKSKIDDAWDTSFSNDTSSSDAIDHADGASIIDINEHTSKKAFAANNKEISKETSEIDILINRARDAMKSAPDEDKNDIINLIEDMTDAIESGDDDALNEASQELEDILFYLE